MISEHEIHHASILIVDDQQSNVHLLEQMLRESGYVPFLLPWILMQSTICIAKTILT